MTIFAMEGSILKQSSTSKSIQFGYGSSESCNLHVWLSPKVAGRKMALRQISLLLIIFGLLVSQVTYSAPSCRRLMDDEPTKSREAPKPEDVRLKPADVLNPQQLKKYGFILNKKNQLVDILTDQGIIGVVTILQPKNLYEWADLDYQQAWIANGGISTIEIKEILNELPQTYGRGYYVSTNPFDSSSGYGDALTIFRTDGPLVRVDSPYPGQYDAAFLNRMRLAGIDAMLAGMDTWLAMISARHLKVETQKVQDPYWTSSESAANIDSILGKLVYSNLQGILPKHLIPEEDLLPFLTKKIEATTTELNPITYANLMQLLTLNTKDSDRRKLFSLFNQKTVQLIQKSKPAEVIKFYSQILESITQYNLYYFDLALVILDLNLPNLKASQPSRFSKLNLIQKCTLLGLTKQVEILLTRNLNRNEKK